MIRDILHFTLLREWFQKRESIGLVVAIMLVIGLLLLGFCGVSRVDGFHLAGG